MNSRETILSSVAKVLNANEIPDGSTVSSQMQALSIAIRVFAECREGLQEKQPLAAEDAKQLEDSLGEAIVTLRAARDIKRMLSLFDV